MITQEQIEFRKGKLGASDVGTALGLNPWQTPAELAHRLLNPDAFPFTDTVATRVGNYMEPFIAGLFTEATGVAVSEFGSTLVHPEHRWLIAHPDYARKTGGALLEIKNVGWRVAKKWGPDGSPDGVPPYVVAQCAVQTLLAFGKERAVPVDVCAYFGGNDVRIYHLDFSDFDFDAMIDGLVEFWGYVERKEYPPLTGGDKALVAEINSEEDKGSALVAGDALMTKIKQCLHYRRLAKEIEAEALKYEVLVKASIGKFERVVDEHNRTLATWKSAAGASSPNWEEIAKAALMTRNPKNLDDEIKFYTRQKGIFVKERAGGRRFSIKEVADE